MQHVSEPEEDMVAGAIGAVLAFAVGVGISPVPIIAVILMLFSTRARVNGPLFLVGWMAGLAVVVTLAYLMAVFLDVGASAAADEGVSWLRILLGAGLAFAAVRKWRDRPDAGEEPAMPRWMTGVERFGPGKALGLSLALSANPKNLLLAVGAATSLAQSGPGMAEAVAGLATFVLVGSSIVILAVAYDFFGGTRARARLDEAKAWLGIHNQAVMAVLFAVFAAVLISQGLGLRE